MDKKLRSKSKVTEGEKECTDEMVKDVRECDSDMNVLEGARASAVSEDATAQLYQCVVAGLHETKSGMNDLWQFMSDAYTGMNVTSAGMSKAREGMNEVREGMKEMREMVARQSENVNRFIEVMTKFLGNQPCMNDSASSGTASDHKENVNVQHTSNVTTAQTDNAHTPMPFKVKIDRDSIL